MDKNTKTDTEYWDSEYDIYPRNKLKSQFWVGTRDYYKLLGRFIVPQSKVLEIGCAPGKTLAWAAKKKHALVTGVDYSRKGIDISKWLFEQLGLNGTFLYENIFETSLPNDFFDVVFSSGFIEHFNDPTEIIDIHLALVKPGGVVLIVIPNYGGVYGKLQKIFSPENLLLHNLKIMNVENLRNIISFNQTIENINVYCFGRTHPFLVHFHNKINSHIAWCINLLWNCIGWFQPVAIHALSPFLVLEIHKS